MFEELNKRRQIIVENILKSFSAEESYIEKGECDEFEKARQKKTFAVGDTFTRHGITYKCTGISANTGRPTWSKVKDKEGSKPENVSVVSKDEDKKRKIEIPKRISENELLSSKENIKSVYKRGDELWDLFKNTIVDFYKNISDDPIKAEKYGKESLNNCEKIYEKYGWGQLENYSIPQGWWIYVDKLNSVKDEEKQNKSKLNIVSSATYIYAKDKDGNLYVLAGRRGSTAPTGANKLNPPMGMIDYGETPEESAVREIEEETGLKINKKDLIDNGEEEYANRKGVGGKNYSVMLSGDISKYKIGEGDGENSKFTWVKVEDIKDEDWAFGTGGTAKKFKPKKDSKKMKNISDLQIGDEVTIVTDNNGDITKKKGKITSMTSSAYEINGDRSLRFQKRTGGHVGMDNVKITIS